MDDEEISFAEQKQKSEFEKLALEKEKLTEEIRHLKKGFFKTPQVWAPIATITIALIGVFLTFQSGIFDAKRLDLQNQKSLLLIDIDKFEKKKDSLKLQVALSQQNLDSLNNSNKYLRTKLQSLNKQFSAMSLKYKSEKQYIANELKLIDSLLSEGKTKEAADKIYNLVDKINGITGRDFSDDFNDDFK
jgi:hypothetical protein